MIDFDYLLRVERSLLDWVRTKSWNSLLVDYHLPTVHRLWIQDGPNRIYLHKILPCRPNEALYHPHPSPSAVRVYSRYEMGVGSGPAGSPPPPIAARVSLAPNSFYFMTEPDGWHYVAPDNVSFSFMIVGPPWPNQTSPKPSKTLAPLPESEVALLKKEWISGLQNVYHGSEF